jgi:medium-chain acyl-[acyl-carrier-protein] hydrolase
VKIRDTWFTVYRPVSQPVLRLFCFPFAGGSGVVFRDWFKALPAEVELCGIQLPGRESRFKEEPYTRVADLVRDVADALNRRGDVPFVFFGHSMGALVAFELARELRRRHQAGPELLMVSGRRAPQRPDADPPIHALPEPQFLEKIRGFNGTPEAVFQSEELLQLLVPLLRADFAVCETYEYQKDEPLTCPIAAFGGFEDPEVCEEDIAAWSQQTIGSFTLQMFPGDHFYLLDRSATLLRQVTAQVDGVVAGLARRSLEMQSPRGLSPQSLA